jgi:hypothetical protein
MIVRYPARDTSVGSRTVPDYSSVKDTRSNSNRLTSSSLPSSLRPLSWLSALPSLLPSLSVWTPSANLHPEFWRIVSNTIYDLL